MKRFSDLAQGFEWMKQNAIGDCTFMTYHGPAFHRVFVYIASGRSIEFSVRRDFAVLDGRNV
jgi:hypothetical protein